MTQASGHIRLPACKLLLLFQFEIVEVNDAIRFGPESCFAGAGKGRVFHLKDLLAV
jgi:hypothetical protein